MRLGLIQTRGIGDLVIALPIAQHFVALGHEVHWPVDSRFLGFMAAAAPEVRFHPIDPSDTGDQTPAYFYDAPLAVLQGLGCDAIQCLYSYLTGRDVVNEKLARALKFDEYKYAVTGVPFSRKWDLRIRRDAAREQALFDSLGVRGPYVLVHATASGASINVNLAPQLVAGRQVIELTERTDNPFDWLLALERASLLVLIDSVFANLVEQLNFPNPKILMLKAAEVPFTPVFKNGWTFY
ncbi:MAG: hypothetical protein ACM30I_02110 [Gemmatimonas sp.]